jgi:hypothetical protein
MLLLWLLLFLGSSCNKEAQKQNSIELAIIMPPISDSELRQQSFFLQKQKTINYRNDQQIGVIFLMVEGRSV